MTRRNDNSVKAKGGGALALLCNVLGVLLIVAVIALAAPLTVPRLLGFEVYEVVSGSMEPAISTGSAVYAKQVEPTSVTEGDIIAFLENEENRKAITAPEGILERVHAYREKWGAK